MFQGCFLRSVVLHIMAMRATCGAWGQGGGGWATLHGGSVTLLPFFFLN